MCYMQNKTLLAGIAAAVIILLGAGGIFLYSKNKTASTPNSTTATQSPTQNEKSSEGSLADIFSNPGNKKCEYSVKSEEGEANGIIYNSGEKAYGEIKLTANNKTQMTYFIRNGDTFYMWGDSLPSGIKMTLSVEEMTSRLSGDNSNQPSVVPNQKVDFKCSDWSVDTSKFNPPSNVKFTDMSSVIKDLGVTGSPTASDNSSSECAICNSLTGAAKTACLDQFSC